MGISSFLFFIFALHLVVHAQSMNTSLIHLVSSHHALGGWTCEELSPDYGRANSLLDVSTFPCVASYDLENLYENCHNGTAWNRVTVDSLTPGDLWSDISYR